MRLLATTGLLDVEDHEELDDLLAYQAESFLRAGGTLTLGDWTELDHRERTAFVEAGERIRAEHAVQIAAGVFNPQYRASLYSVLDGGSEAARVAVESAVQEAASKVESSPPLDLREAQ